MRVGGVHTPSIAFRHLPPRKDVVNRRSEFGWGGDRVEGCEMRGGGVQSHKGVGVWLVNAVITHPLPPHARPC